MIITETMTVAEVAAAVPAAVRVFTRHHIDFCCGGRKTLRDACSEQGLPFEALTRALDAETATAAADVRDWTREPLAVLIDHIVGTFHKPLRAELPRLAVMAARVTNAHAEKAPALRHVEEVLCELSAALNEHMWKEEHVLFPAIEAMSAGRADPQPWIAAPIAAMEEEHDRAGELLAELRHSTAEYRVPEWGCATLRAFYGALAQLEVDMHVHVHLENNILFPRAIERVRDSSEG
jgi:regulator of cell morphogenesis and NO signaling